MIPLLRDFGEPFLEKLWKRPPVCTRAFKLLRGDTIGGSSGLGSIIIAADLSFALHITGCHPRPSCLYSKGNPARISLIHYIFLVWVSAAGLEGCAQHNSRIPSEDGYLQTQRICPEDGKKVVIEKGVSRRNVASELGVETESQLRMRRNEDDIRGMAKKCIIRKVGVILKMFAIPNIIVRRMSKKT